ncbi:MAG: PEP-CTERM sorting domain-containing protein [Planctomycetota bacterium]
MKRIIYVSLCLLVAGSIANAVLTEVTSEDGRQDPLTIQGWVHELGTGASFPANELISLHHVWTTSIVPCPANYNPQGPANLEVGIQNMTNICWTDLHFVADAGITLTNDDGWINGQLAFKIDNVGVNIPLINEIGGNIPLVFEPGEIWEFVIQNYNPPAAAVAFGSIGVPSTSAASTASIIAIPEPMTLAVLAVGAIGLLRRKK